MICYVNGMFPQFVHPQIDFHLWADQKHQVSVRRVAQEAIEYIWNATFLAFLLFKPHASFCFKHCQRHNGPRV